jgi:hypothetical protein
MERTVNKGPLKRNTRINLINETITNLRKVSKSFKCKETHNRITNRNTNRNAQNEVPEKTDSTHIVRIRGGGGESDDEDLFFVSSDDDEEEVFGKNKNDNNKETEEEDGTNNNEEEGTTTTNKKMKITQENIPFGHVCDDIAIDDDTPYIRVYCQNVSGIFDRDGIGLDLAFNEIKQANVDIFTFNETHGDESNAVQGKH